jgi:drug/metabolite transporter (DMT)-like permease
VVAVLLGMIVLNEEFGWRTLAGGAMIMLGIAFIVLKRNRYQPVQSVAKP